MQDIYYELNSVQFHGKVSQEFFLAATDKKLEAKGAVFFEQLDANGGDISKAIPGSKISCGLTNPSDWITQTVTLTLENVKDPSNKITCTTTNGASVFSCTGGAGGVASVTPTETTEVSMTATLDTTPLTSTVVYRCSVEVGADVDEKATDTKLIYVQKIRVRYDNDNLEKYKMMKEGDKLKVSVYGDDAYALAASGNTCKIGDGANSDLKDVVVGQLSVAGVPESLALTCTFTFADNTKLVAHQVPYSDPGFKIVDDCVGDVEVYQNGCKECSGNSYREQGSSQFDECKKCPAGKEPKTDNSGCDTCSAGKFSTDDAKCNVCPAGSKSVDGFCQVCEEGTHAKAAGATECALCPAGSFSSALGSQDCTTCPAGSFSSPGASSCQLCAAGTYAEGGTSCKPCVKGQYSAAGSSACTLCPEGTKANAEPTDKVGATSCTKCPAGEYNDETGQTSCTVCSSSEYSPEEGSTFCLKCKGKIDNNRCTNCNAGEELKTIEDVDRVVTCEACASGHISLAGMESCIACPPGKKKNAEGDKCDECEAGTYQPESSKDTCLTCEADKGHFQPAAGETYCKKTRPGFQLDEGSNKKDEVPCEKNSYSTGGARKCTKCESGEGEYTDSTGSTYCNVCQFNLDSEGNCGTINCKENKIELEGIGSGNFTFPDTSAGGTASVKCDEAKEDGGEMITRYCRYNALTKEVEWASADSSACSSKFTEQVTNLVDQMNAVDLKDDSAKQEAVEGMKNLATNANEMAPKDLSNIATSLSTFTTNLATQGVAVNDQDASDLASTIGSVAGVGEEKMTSVSETEKTQMRGCVTTLAKQLANSKPVETDSIGMQKFSLDDIKSETALTLPKPKNDTVAAPKLKMKDTANAKGNAIAPTVAVFDKKTAAAIFPMPGTSSDEDANSDGGSTKSKNITYAIDSSIVSLEFAGATELDIEIEIAVDTSKDVEQSSRNVERIRTCKFYNETTKEWSTKGCETKVGDTISGDEQHYLCACQHNTSFAIILSSAEIADTVQSTVSSVLNVINLVFLGLTFLCIAPFKQFQARRLIQIQTQLCIALFVGHISFLILGTTNASNKACVPGVIIVQYLFLVAVAWSVCASVTLYEKIVNALKSFGKQDKHYFVKCLAGCWSAPLFMVLSAYITSISLDANLPYVTATGELDDDKTETCWVASPWKWVGFIIPVYLCLGINVILFVMIARIIIRAGKSGSNTSHAREIKAIMSIATTVCLPWLIALLMAGPPAMAQIFQWVFIIVTASQGPTMFICFVIFQEDVLTNLFSLFGKEPPQVLLAPKSSKASKSAASEISSVKPTTAAVKKEEKSDIVHVKNPEYNDPAQQEENRQSEENIYSKVDEEAPPVKDDTISRGSVSSKHMYEATSFTQHGDKNDNITPVPAVEQGETYENNAANDLDIAQNSYPHVPQLV